MDAGTPWLYARRIPEIEDQNTTFLKWCRLWITELYAVEGTAVRAAKTEPHIVKYAHAS